MSAALHVPERRLTHPLKHFFYAEEVPYGLALVRIVLPLVLFGVMLYRWPHARELYSADGAPTQLAYSFGYGNLLPEFSGEVVVAMMSAMLFFLMTSSLGWCTRFSLAAATILYTYFNLLDAAGTITKYSVIATHALFILCLSNCGAVWSIDRLLQRPKMTAGLPGQLSPGELRCPVWPQRLMQLMIGIVYFGAAITKLHTPEYFSGEQLMFWMRTNVNYPHPVGEWLTLYPVLLILFAYIAIVWEILFLFLVWRSWGRVCMLAMGSAFHLMTTLTLGLYVFPAVCVSIYLVFLDEDRVRRLAAWRRTAGRRLSRRWKLLQLPRIKQRAAKQPRHFPIPSPAVFACAVVMVGVAAVELEYQLDPYGLRRPEGPHALRELDRDVVQAMLAGSQPVRPQDKIFAFETGTLMAGDTLLNRRVEFRHGDTVVAQCRMNPPFEDMWLECTLVDHHNRLIDRVPSIVSREMRRCNFYYQLTEVLEPGTYELVLKAAGYEVARKTITLESAIPAPVAN